MYSVFHELMVFKIVGMHTADLEAPHPTSGTMGDGMRDVMPPSVESQKAFSLNDVHRSLPQVIACSILDALEILWI